MQPMGGEVGLGSGALHTGLWVWLRSPTLLHAVHLGAAEQQAARGSKQLNARRERAPSGRRVALMLEVDRVECATGMLP